MAWITPKTDWTDAEHVTYDDMNRIAGNVNYLAGTSLKDDYTQDDVVTLTEWKAIITALNDLVENEGYTMDGEPDESTTALNFNTVESITKGTKEWIDLKEYQHVADIYANDDIYPDTVAGDWARGGD